MLFNTPQFVLTIIIFTTFWYIIPNTFKKALLLLFSYYFAYLLGGISTVIILFCVTVITYLYGRIISLGRAAKGLCISFIILLVVLLLYCKYTKYFLDIIIDAHIIPSMSINVLSAIGISYYVFQAISYIVDIYKGEDVADKNIINVALWLAFFPKIIAGPIERHKTFEKQLNNINMLRFNEDKLKRGMLICSVGYFYKMIIADRLGIFVDQVYLNLDSCRGITLFIAMIAYSLQIYFDFSGYSMIAYGFSHALGIKISKNFDHPYFSSSVNVFWRKWHTSLSSWLKDYVYIPLGGNRKGKPRQYLNIILTFLISGAWHGAGLSYLIWGGLHGFFQVVEKMLNLKRVNKYINGITTFLLVSFAWIFFRASSTNEALRFIRQMIYWNPKILTDGTLSCYGLDVYDWIVVLVAVSIAVMIEVIQIKGISIYNILQNHTIVVRWSVYLATIIALIVFGKYGAKYDASNFIYYQF